MSLEADPSTSWAFRWDPAFNCRTVRNWAENPGPRVLAWLTHRNWEIIVCCFNIKFVVICYMAINNEYTPQTHYNNISLFMATSQPQMWISPKSYTSFNILLIYYLPVRPSIHPSSLLWTRKLSSFNSVTYCSVLAILYVTYLHI